jgi:hypothetical protein
VLRFVRRQNSGGIAQLVERLVRNEKVRGSNPLASILANNIIPARLLLTRREDRLRNVYIRVHAILRRVAEAKMRGEP